MRGSIVDCTKLFPSTLLFRVNLHAKATEDDRPMRVLGQCHWNRQ
jgi:hypothetical protein